MKVQTFTSKGTKIEDTNLPKEFSVKVNLPLLAQALYVYEERSHVGLRKTKTRAEVLRTTKKLYRQKGTGGARHGSRRAPIFVGGGVALGPRPVRRVLNLTNDIKSKAKFMAFALKANEGKLIFVSGISKLEKTKAAGELVDALKKAVKAKRFTFVLANNASGSIKVLRNLVDASCLLYKDVSALDIYRGGTIIMDEEIFAENKTTGSKEATKTAKTVKKIAKKEIKK